MSFSWFSLLGILGLSFILSIDDIRNWKNNWILSFTKIVNRVGFFFLLLFPALALSYWVNAGGVISENFGLVGALFALFTWLAVIWNTFGNYCIEYLAQKS